MKHPTYKANKKKLIISKEILDTVLIRLITISIKIINEAENFVAIKIEASRPMEKNAQNSAVM